MWGVLLKPKSCSLLLYCQRAAVPRCQVLLQRPMLPCANPALAQKPSAQRMLASSASSSSSAPSADQKQGISREEYNQRQRSVFSSPNLTQIFAQEVEEDVQQARAQTTYCILVLYAHHDTGKASSKVTTWFPAESTSSALKCTLFRVTSPSLHFRVQHPEYPENFFQRYA
eukprot:1161851-Pelagomonas_calceolata.AAC.2